MCRLLPLLTIFAMPYTSALGAQERPDSVAFIIRLGTDTTAVERYVRSADALVAEAVSRAPRTMRHRLVIRFGPDGRVTAAEIEQRAPGAAEPSTRTDITFQGDSATIASRGPGGERTRRVAARDAIPVAGPFYAPFELATMQAVRSGRDSLGVMLLSGGEPVEIPVVRIGPDSLALTDQFDQPIRARVDRQGQLLAINTPGYATIERLRWVDLDALTRQFATLDESGRGLGQLSPRAAFRTSLDGATIWVDYSRPGARGRPLFGGLVPFDAVWRTGANAATHFATDRTLRIGELTVPPGAYTLFTIPAPDAWTLIISRATGIGGLNYDAAHDLGRTTMQVGRMPDHVEQLTIDIDAAEDGGVLEVMWGDTRAWTPIRVSPSTQSR